MDYQEDQRFVPGSFWALYRDERQRLTEAREVILAAYGLCEDMAQLLAERCGEVHFRDGIDEQEVLERALAGLVSAGSQFTRPQAEWILRRSAELLDWEEWLPPD
jgi:hypothetical protein